MTTARAEHYTATLLPNGKVLVAGGFYQEIGLASAELFSGGAAADTTPPVLNLPGTITVDATSPAGAVVTYSVSATDPDNQPSQLVINCSLSAPTISRRPQRPLPIPAASCATPPRNTSITCRYPSAASGTLFTIRVRPFGDSDPADGM